MIGRSLNSRITGQARFSRKTKDAEDVMKMLIVEDQEKHLADAKATVKKLEQKFELEVRYAGTLEEAKKELDWAEVVVTDLFFPEKAGESPDPPMRPLDELGPPSKRAIFAEQHMSGIKLTKLCIEQKKPVVICTSTHHHGAKTQPACDWIREQGMELVDVYPEDSQAEAKTKKWHQAILMAIILRNEPAGKLSWEIFNWLRGSVDKCVRNVEGWKEEMVAWKKPEIHRAAEVLIRYDSIPKDA